MLPACILAGALSAAESTMDLEKTTTELAGKFGALATDPLKPEDIRSLCESLLPKTRALAESYREELAKSNPELTDFMASRLENPTTKFEKAPVVLYGGATEAQVLDCWRTQLRHCVEAIAGLAGEEKSAVGDWMYWDDYAGARKVARPFFRARALCDATKEAQKLVELLTLPREITKIAAGEALFSDSFKTDLSAWQTFGGGEVEIKDGRLHVKGKGVTVWCAKDFENAVVSFEYNPVATAGKGAGALFAFPGSPAAGKTYEASSGSMDNYNVGIHTYHVSLFRGTGNSNLRRTGSGLRMLSLIRPDPCGEAGKRYRVEILRYAQTVQVHVDGKLCHSYVDAGCYGPCLKSGRFGVRHFSAAELESFYGDFKVCGLKVAPQ
jgi:hypothetical protein